MEANEIINAIGAIAEITSIYHTTLIRNGVAQDDAVALTSVMVKTLIEEIMSNGKRNDEE